MLGLCGNFPLQLIEMNQLNMGIPFDNDKIYILLYADDILLKCTSIVSLWNGRPGGWPCTELLAPIIFHTLVPIYIFRAITFF